MPLFRLLTPKLTPIYVSVDGPCPAEKLTAWVALLSKDPGRIWLVDHEEVRAFVNLPANVSMDESSWTSHGLSKLDTFRLNVFVKAWDKKAAGEKLHSVWYDGEYQRDHGMIFSPPAEYIKMAVLLQESVILDESNWIDTSLSDLEVLKRYKTNVVWRKECAARQPEHVS